MPSFDKTPCHGTLPVDTPGYMSFCPASLVLIAPPSSLVGRLFTRAAPDLPMVQCATVAGGLHAISRGHVRLFACEPRDANGQSTEGLLGTVASKYPSIGTIGIVPRARVEGSAVIRLVRAGAHALLMIDDRITTLECRQVLTEASVRAGVGMSGPSLLALVPTTARPLLEYGLRYAHDAITVAQTARALQVHRKTLFLWCAGARLPAPQQLLGWCRLLAAGALLEDEGRRVDHIALDLDFPSGTALRNQFVRYTGKSPSELRACGPRASIYDGFVRALTRRARH